MKSGFIAILGRPNVGKSSLVNALVGEKVSIVSPKAQTTRDSVLGIVTDDDCQMIFVDTPGIHRPRNKLGEYMDGEIKRSQDGIDAAVIVLDGTRALSESEREFIESRLREKNVPLFVVVNKIDLIGYEEVYPILKILGEYGEEREDAGRIASIIPLSARSGENVEKLRDALKEVLPQGEKYFPDDEYTDKSERYMICEIIREKALLFLRDEIPHGIGVAIQTMTDKGKVVEIEADVICEKKSHKSIIIGKGGETLKTLGTSARMDMEKLLEKKVYLKLFVKVRDGWRNNIGVIRDVGYIKKK